MPKQPVSINFSQGLNTKQDPWQLPLGQFLRLENSVFDKGGQLKKRNGYGKISNLPNNLYSYLTTFNNNLTAIGPTIAAYNESAEVWVPKGVITPLSLNTLPIIRNNLNQSQCDTAIAVDGLVCTVYTEVNNAVSTYKYVIANAVTGQNIVAPTVIPVSSGVVTGSPRVFLLGSYFVIVFTNVISGTSHLQYISIATFNPTIVTANHDIAASYVSNPSLSWDGAVLSGSLYIAYNTTSGGQSVKVTSLSIGQAATGASPATATTFASSIGNLISVCVDSTLNFAAVYISMYDSSGKLGYVAAVNANLGVIFSPTLTFQPYMSAQIVNVTSAASNGLCTLVWETAGSYGYDSSIPTNFLNTGNISISGSLLTSFESIRSVGLASKAFIINEQVYVLAAYQSPFQSTYFLVNISQSVSAAPVIAAKLAYENGGGYLTAGLPSISVNGTIAQFAYLYKDLIEALTTTNNSQQSVTGGIYSQTGINLASLNFSPAIDTSEVGNNLHISGGFLGMYDGYLPVEHNFFLWPDSVELTASAAAVTPTGTVTSGSNVITAVSSMTGVGIGALITGTAIPVNQVITAITSNTITFGPLTATGSHTAETITVTGQLSAQSYFYQAVYEWSDNQGNVHRSAGSIPVSVTTTGSTSTVAVNIPMLRVTMKTTNPVKIVIYRYSAGQPIYHQIISITAPLLNNPIFDYITFFDPMSDAMIQGNSTIYTNGGVIEDVNAPSSSIMTLFDTRLWLVDAEDPNLLWFSKQVIEATPVEMSDLLTLYVAPNTGTTSTTGPITGLAPMDDKLVIFKADAIYYINGSGPDNTGANNQYSQPIFVSSAVGCSDQSSIVLMNDGLMFQSDKGIWLLNRGLAVSYIGAAVDDFNSSAVNSSNNIPKTNQVRQTLSTGQTLMFDYYYQQWGTFKNVPAISSTIYQGEHTYINQYGSVYQETPGAYLDGPNPTLMGFSTGWINIAALQGFERFYYFYLVGRYLSPHKLQIKIAFDYNDSAYQSVVITPHNFSASVPSPFGEQPAPFGSPVDLEQWKIYPRLQKCQSFQISVDELYDPSLGAIAGPGLTLSGINMLVSVKSGSRPIRAANTAGK